MLTNYIMSRKNKAKAILKLMFHEDVVVIYRRKPLLR
jgi:hypothetical protein